MAPCVAGGAAAEDEESGDTGCDRGVKGVEEEGGAPSRQKDAAAGESW
jgi:hypothetical protein